ncbi:MAG: hypothetical protein ACKO8Y_09710, partial [Actinomycetota bacterium]
VVSCRIRYEGTEATDAAAAAVAAIEREVRLRAAPHVFAADGGSLQDAVIARLSGLGARLASRNRQ